MKYRVTITNENPDSDVFVIDFDSSDKDVHDIKLFNYLTTAYICRDYLIKGALLNHTMLKVSTARKVNNIKNIYYIPDKGK